jgi:hypothetical protein
MGIGIAISPDRSARAIREIGIGFLFAPAVHTAMKNAQPVRQDLKMRTVFNLLGPLTNPAGATAQLIGAPSARAAELMSGAIAALGLRSAITSTEEAWMKSPPPAHHGLQSMGKVRSCEPWNRPTSPVRTANAAAGPEAATGPQSGNRVRYCPALPGPPRSLSFWSSAAPPPW